jgi:hypothetical protein
MSTQLLENPHKIAAFVAFLVARGVVSTTITKHITHIKKVLVWRASLGGPLPAVSLLKEVMEWVDIMHKQCPNIALPSRGPAQRINLPTATEVLKFQLAVMDHSQTMLAEDISKWQGMKRAKTAQACQDSAMMSLAFGFLPPLRLGCIRSCLHPDHVQDSGGCQDAECRQGPSCKGNRLEWVPSSNKTRLMVCFPHHKNEARWDNLPIGPFELPPALTQTLMPWVQEGHSMLVPRSRHLFVHFPSGLPLSNVNFSHWWQSMLNRFEAPFRFPPSQLRHIFVDERCSTDHCNGPENRGAARVMGNSVERWAISYDSNIHVREVQAAVQAMQQWREELLALVE